MERFLALTEEKQKTIVDAGMLIFGKMGYRKASVADIAAASGISKGMVFHYFGSKKQMYLYLIEQAFRVVEDSVKSIASQVVTDFFDRIQLGTELKLSVLRRNPGILQFLSSVYFEADSEVADEVRVFLERGVVFRESFVFTGLDKSKFKETVDPELVLRILVKFSEGYVGNGPLSDDFDLEAASRECSECLNLMRNHFYKEEYL